VSCRWVMLYMYVESGILAVHNPEGDVLEFLTMEEAGVVGEMFYVNNAAPMYLSTRTHSVIDRKPPPEQEANADKNPSSKDGTDQKRKRVTIQVEDPAGEELEPGSPKLQTPEEVVNRHRLAAGESVFVKKKSLSPLPEGGEEGDDRESPKGKEQLNGCLMPRLSVPIRSMLIMPMRQKMTAGELRKQRSHFKDYESEDSDDDFDLGDEPGALSEGTWAIMVAINKDISREEDEDASIWKEVAEQFMKPSDEKPSRRRGKSARNLMAPDTSQKKIPQAAGTPSLGEFVPSDETMMDKIGKLVYPAIVNSQVVPILRQHLQRLE